MIPKVIVGIIGVLVGLIARVGSGQEPTVHTVPPNQAAFLISLPTADAKIKVEGSVLKEKGLERLYFTPILNRGETYEYEIESTWMEAGQEKRAVRQVRFQTGHVYSVDFRSSSSTATILSKD